MATARERTQTDAIEREPLPLALLDSSIENQIRYQ